MVTWVKFDFRNTLSHLPVGLLARRNSFFRPTEFYIRNTMHCKTPGNSSVASRSYCPRLYTAFLPNWPFLAWLAQLGVTVRRQDTTGRNAKMKGRKGNAVYDILLILTTES